ncbi:MAG TPA: prepilin-type N-terminal cleavage/methylation domain-containing protein [Candidatus Pacearchaeota archaeon]|nr:prepilin-type N-terminal cleavage/methylation domain-containing protein [Candidatus Pacearchaeota archaeon]
MNKSFTLIEILVVIVIIGILSTFILVGTNSITKSANFAKGKAFSNSLRNSLLINLVSEWKFDGPSDSGIATTNDVKDSWGINNGIIISGNEPTIEISNCTSGHCLDFDGVDDRIDVGNHSSLNLTDYITIEYWANIQGQSSNGYCSETVSRRGCYDVCCNILYSTIDGHPDIVLASGSSPGYNIWFHAVYTYDSETTFGKFYRDSRLLNNREISSLYPGYTTYKMGSSCSNLYISNSVYRFNGILDEIKIYNRVLSSSQIKQNYYVGLNKLFKNNKIVLDEFKHKIIELKSNLSTHE